VEVLGRDAYGLVELQQTTHVVERLADSGILVRPVKGADSAVEVRVVGDLPTVGNPRIRPSKLLDE
jgi:hypothetical protein